MNAKRRPARLVLPGRIISRELEARGWQQRDLAEVMGRPEQAISEIINAKKQITPETARELAVALGTSPDLWLNLEMSHRLGLAEREQAEEAIRRRARLYRLVPYRELVKRGWIEDHDTLDHQEREICRFLAVSTLDERPPLAMAARLSRHGTPEEGAQLAWARRVEQLAGRQRVADYSRQGLLAAIPRMLGASANESRVSGVRAALHEVGVHLAIVPALPQTYLDGAALYIGDNPIVGLTLRYHRVDSFWFTLMHELAHVVLGHQGAYLDRLFDREGDESAREQEANAQASDWLIDPVAYAAFRRQGRVTNAAIRRFAAEIGRHPSIVAGRLQFETGNYRRHSRLHRSVRPYLEPYIDG